jgi:uroporphyrinogen-III synthase
MRRVIVLRPEPGASETVARAHEFGLDAVAISLFEIEPVDWQVPDASGFDGILLTSANAIRHAGPRLTELRRLPAYAVGEVTADAARNAGFEVAATGNSGVERLLNSIDPGLRLLHLSGQHRKNAVSAPQPITAVVVYRAGEIAAPDLTGIEDAVLLVHSSRAGRRLAELVRDRAAASIAAISLAAAEEAGDGWAAVEAADQPSDDALLALAARLCNKPAA